LCEVRGNISHAYAETDLGGVDSALGCGGSRPGRHHLRELILEHDAAGFVAGGIGVGQVVGDDIEITLMQV
jgi:hypothetical protein